jgi:protoporphyrinogen/coproporphyrinogen III oxidase
VKHVIIVGGGIAGLSAAHALASRARVTVLEAGDQWGGKLQSATIHTAQGSVVVDAAAESFITRKPAAHALACALGLSDQLLDPGSETQGVFVWREGRMRAVPTGPAELLRTDLLSASGKWRASREPWTKKSDRSDDESVHAFMARRFGAEAAEVFGPVMAGICNLAPEQLSVRAAFPLFGELEQQHGSIIKGMMARAKSNQASGLPRSFTFRGGVSTLIEALVGQLGGAELRLNHAVKRVTSQPTGVTVVLERGDVLTADDVILAVDAPRAAAMMQHDHPTCSTAMMALPHTSIATLALVYPRAALAHLTECRGIMVPRPANRAIDAILFTSHKMPMRASGEVGLVRVFVGAARPELVTMAADDLVPLVAAELHDMVGLPSAPLAHRIFRWPQSFPAMTVGHLERVKAVTQLLPPHVAIAGASYAGIGVPDCVRHGQQAADQILHSMEAS